MSRTSISRPEIEKLTRAIIGPAANYTEAGGEAAVHIGTKIIAHTKVDTYAPRKGRALIGRWLLDQNARREAGATFVIPERPVLVTGDWE